MKPPFHEASYNAQVLRLRKLAGAALRLYPIDPVEMKFINHGENTTFQITSRQGERFMLRIHRLGYHSASAIREELRWLKHLSERVDFSVPVPVASREGELLAECQVAELEAPRNCVLFKWIEGRFISKSLSLQHFEQVGRLSAELQKRSLPTKHRRYWNTEGLVGKKPKFGELENVTGLSRPQKAALLEGRAFVHSKLRAFESKYPEKMGLIHADLHFGNLIKTPTGLGVIDFDDCGYGFHAYDLAIPLVVAENFLRGKNEIKKLPHYKEALLRGYSADRAWRESDDRALPHLVAARRLMMVGWLQSRSDNPKVRPFLKPAALRALRCLRGLR